MGRFLLQESQMKENHFVCTDTEHLIVCVFEKHRFNETQEVTTLENFDTKDFMKLATYLREMGEWLRKNHAEKLFLKT